MEEISSKIASLEVHISDLEHMGGELILRRLVMQKFLFRKYEGQLWFGNDLYYVYVKHSFFMGERLSGIAVPMYRNKEYAIMACRRLNETYRKALLNNINDIQKKRRKRILMEIVLFLIMFGVVCMYLQRTILVAQSGMNFISVILSILYPVIAALCYIVHYKLQ